MTWNYRLCKRTASCEEFYGIHEVYYNSDGEITMVTENPVDVFGETASEVRSILNMMKAALKKDTIDLDAIVFAKVDDTPLD